MSFLKAEWRKLLIVNYKVDPDLLQAYVPAKTELDTWEGRNYVSLVGFRFLNTRLLGIKVPFHVHFEEVNLRFYVRYKAEKEWRRGRGIHQRNCPPSGFELGGQYNIQGALCHASHESHLGGYPRGPGHFLCLV